MKQLRMMPTLARTFAKNMQTALGSRSIQRMALACYWRTVNTLMLSVKLASVVGESAQLRTKVSMFFGKINYNIIIFLFFVFLFQMFFLDKKYKKPYRLYLKTYFS